MQFVNIEVIFPLIMGLAIIIFLIGLSVVKVILDFGKLEATVNYYRDRTLPVIQQSLITYHLLMRVIRDKFTPDEFLALQSEIELFFYDQYNITNAVEKFKETGKRADIPLGKETLDWVFGLIETSNVFFSELMTLIPVPIPTLEKIVQEEDQSVIELDNSDAEEGDSTDKQD